MGSKIRATSRVSGVVQASSSRESSDFAGRLPEPCQSASRQSVETEDSLREEDIEDGEESPREPCYLWHYEIVATAKDAPADLIATEEVGDSNNDDDLTASSRFQYFFSRVPDVFGSWAQRLRNRWRGVPTSSSESDATTLFKMMDLELTGPVRIQVWPPTDAETLRTSKHAHLQERVDRSGEVMDAEGSESCNQGVGQFRTAARCSVRSDRRFARDRNDDDHANNWCWAVSKPSAGKGATAGATAWSSILSRWVGIMRARKLPLTEAWRARRLGELPPDVKPPNFALQRNVRLGRSGALPNFEMRKVSDVEWFQAVEEIATQSLPSSSAELPLSLPASRLV